VGISIGEVGPASRRIDGAPPRARADPVCPLARPCTRAGRVKVVRAAAAVGTKTADPERHLDALAYRTRPPLVLVDCPISTSSNWNNRRVVLEQPHQDGRAWCLPEPNSPTKPSTRPRGTRVYSLDHLAQGRFPKYPRYAPIAKLRAEAKQGCRSCRPRYCRWFSRALPTTLFDQAGGN